MRLGYPCLNWGIGCKGDRTFRLKSYDEQRLVATVEANLECLMKMLEFNVAHGLLFFRITSDLVPFASHPVNRFDWQKHFAPFFESIGRYARSHGVRLSMHPDQFVLLNSPSEEVTARSIAELEYHVAVLEAMGLGQDAKVQIHVGGVYGDKRVALERFVRRWDLLPSRLTERIVVENDERLYSLKDCLSISKRVGVPVVFDWFHHRLFSSGEGLAWALERVAATWAKEDGPPIVDYSSQEPGARPGSHAHTIDLDDFKTFLEESRPFDFDLMLEIKDKEASALKALALVRRDPRFKG